ncbi:MAG: STAS domain-containing protein [Spirochaetes bacterium]|nr:STAS domain-containing protein [Spirochaetota bacterium]
MIFISHSAVIDDKAIIVDVKGALNSENSADFEDYINQLLSRKKSNIVINAENIEYISSAGIGVILYIQKKVLAQKGMFIICSVTDEIQALFKLLGFDKVIRTAADKAEAIQIMDKHFKLEEEIRKEQIDIMNQSQMNIDSGEIKTDSDNSLVMNFYKDNTEKVFENPIILECSNCKSMIRVKKSGNYICPDCKTEFFVDPDQTVTF